MTQPIYTVRQLAKLSGVTPRTLRWYDKAGLLPAADHGKNGYRLYGERELLRLQQILFFRELDFPLHEIKSMLDHPDFDVAESLSYQRRLLTLKKQRLERIIRAIDETITMQNDERPTESDMYGALSREEIDAYKKEARDRWGHTDAYRQSQERVKGFTKADWQRMREETESYSRELAVLLQAGAAPDSPEVQKQIARHHAGIQRFYDCPPQMYRGLGDMYLADERFASTYRKYHKDLPEFLVKGMHAFCDKMEAEGK